jgi:hypothetical protein
VTETPAADKRTKSAVIARILKRMKNSLADYKESCKSTSAQAVPSIKFVNFQKLGSQMTALFHDAAPFNRTTTVRGLKRLCLNGASYGLSRAAAQHETGFC